MEVSLTTLDIRGEDVEVRVSSSGVFRASLGGKDHSDKELEGLRRRLMAASRRKSVKVEVPFSQLESSGLSGRFRVVHGVATGLHAQNRDIIVQYDGRRGAERISGGYKGEHFRPLKQEEEEKLVRLAEAKRDAGRALSAYEAELRLVSGLRVAVENAIAAAEVEPREKERDADV